MLHSSVNILLVDDDDVDVMGVQRAFDQLKMSNPLHVAGDGLEALEMLRGTNGRAAVPKPLLVLLDLNMPRMNGVEFLETIRHDPDLNQTVIFVLTTSNAPEDRYKAYQNYIAGYIVKSDSTYTFLEVLEMLNRYCQVIDFP